MRKTCGRKLLSAMLLVAFTCTSVARGQEKSLSTTLAGAQQAKREVAVTFDDLPAPYGDLENLQYITTRLLASVKRQGVPAVGFVNEGKLYRRGEVDARISLLQAWLDAGLELGNHTFSHINMNAAPLNDYRDDVLRGETVTRMLMREKKMNLRYFRHPFLFTGVTPEYRRGLEEFLAARGYRIAPVSIDNADYILADVYYKAKRRGDTETAKRVADAYVPYMEVMFAYFEGLSAAVTGREIKQILILHANELNADHFDELAAMIKRRGYAFITLEAALKDSAYTLPEAPLPGGMSWLHRWRLAKGQNAEDEPSEPAWITKLYEDGRKK